MVAKKTTDVFQKCVDVLQKYVLTLAPIITALIAILMFIVEYPVTAGILLIASSLLLGTLLVFHARIPRWGRLLLVASLFLLFAVGVCSIAGVIPPTRQGESGSLQPSDTIRPDKPVESVGATTEVQAPKKWDFEDGTTQGWGIYDERRGRVVESPDVVAKPKEFADSMWCLGVDNINVKTKSDTGGGAFKKRLAVRYEGILYNAKVTASVHVPAGADIDYADAKFFLFAGADWEWHESGTAGQGVLLEPGKRMEVSWDFRLEETREWPSPWPWRNILGIQIYVEGTFKGPVYIDNVTITVPQ